MTTKAAQLDSIFSALADPTRRQMIEQLGKRDHTIAELAGMFDMSLPAVSKHIKVLDNAKLLSRERSGKYVVCHYEPKPMKEALKWLNKQQQFWNEGFDKLEKYLDANSK
ncbi:MAG: metalloregulator ArsR/SmtB family transcription factor [Bacteroidota bacterium]